MSGGETVVVSELHCHSRYSDGSDTMAALVAKAATSGVQVLSVTDHDTVAGCIAGQSLAEEAGIRWVNGVEISAFDFDQNRKIHILGYGFDPGGMAIAELCTPVLEARHKNTLRQVAILEQLAVDISLGEVEIEAADAPVWYKQHIMALLVKKGIADGLYGSFYKEHFKGTGPAVGDIRYPSYQDAIEAIRSDGGVAVLAHPGQQNSWDLVPSMVEIGLEGIEVFHPDHGPDEHGRAQNLAQEYGLKLFGGSDYHGSYGSEGPLGSYSPQVLPL